jgi:hypothetical protein
VRFSRSRLSTTIVPLASGVDAATRPVFAPCGTTRTVALVAEAQHCRNLGVEAGRTTQHAVPVP